ncbi:MAG: nitroreductase family protein [Anaerolineae bacterium]
MDDRLEMIFARRSIRRYSGEPVSEADIQSLLEAGMAAPSGSNRKPWHFVAVTDKTVLCALAEAHPYGKMIANAEVGIAVCGEPDASDWWLQDCSAATENILLAAVALGLGGVWIGCYGRPKREQAIRDVLGIPEHIAVMSLLSIGHPGEEKAARTQYDADRVHRDRW